MERRWVEFEEVMASGSWKYLLGVEAEKMGERPASYVVDED